VIVVQNPLKAIFLIIIMLLIIGIPILIAIREDKKKPK
jgi:preprotein translocase subunit YajC